MTNISRVLHRRMTHHHPLAARGDGIYLWDADPIITPSPRGETASTSGTPTGGDISTDPVAQPSSTWVMV